MEFPIIYKKTKTGAVQQYTVKTCDNVIIVEQGQVNGQKQVYTTQILVGKNLGKKNATTPTQQAESEARSKWEKKVKSGYSENPLGTVDVKLPMRIKPYELNTHNVDETVALSYKLDGVNGTYRLENNELSLYSRGGEKFEVIPHHINSIKEIMKAFNITELNGELYKHGEHLQDITAAVKKHRELTTELEFVIFEIPYGKLSYYDRNITKESIKKYIKEKGLTGVDVDVSITAQKSLIKPFHEKAVKLGYEGTIIRNLGGAYEFNVRSSDVFKLKPIRDAEFLVEGYLEDKYGHPVLYCQANNSAKSIFKVKPKGTSEERLEILKNIDKYMGSWYKVEYEQLSKDGKPLKPVGIGLRNCDSNGNPLE